MDERFNGNGVAQLRVADFATASAMTVQRDGKFLVVGETCSSVFLNNCDTAVVRFDSDGSPDDDFGDGGKVVTRLGDTSTLEAVSEAADGTIVAGGRTCDAGNEDCNVLLSRYRSDGSPDDSFGQDGQVIGAHGANSASATSIVPRGGGDLLVAANIGKRQAGNEARLFRYRSDGSPADDFGDGGMARLPLDGGFALVREHGGRLVAAGGRRTGDGLHFGLVGLEGDGSRDESFGSGGKVTTTVRRASTISALAEADGRLVASGYADRSDRSSDFALARYR